jgi:hypothetical protein
MKINRTNEKEKYNVTVGWIGDFINKIAKNPPPSPNISTAKTEKFATIEEKMNDIKNRVGFGNILSKKEGADDSNQKVASEMQCKCNGKCKCEDIKKVEVILKYIKDIVSNEPELPTLAVIDRCKSHAGLGFDNIKIDIDRVKSYINSLKEKNPSSKMDTSYIKMDSTSVDRYDDMADYYRHGTPDVR